MTKQNKQRIVSFDDRSDPSRNVRCFVRQEIKRLDDLREAETRRIAQLMVAESKLRDEIRKTDQRSLDISNEKTVQTASVLADQLRQNSAEQRELVLATSKAITDSMSKVLDPLIARVGLLEQAKYEGQGREKYVDPLITEMARNINELSKLMASHIDVHKGEGSGIKNLWGWIVGVVGAASLVGALLEKYVFK